MCLTTPELISTANDIILALAAVFTAYAAVNGLNTWNRQLRGTADFDVARRLAKASYKVREKFQTCRSPFILYQEFPPEYHKEECQRSDEQEAEGYAFLY